MFGELHLLSTRMMPKQTAVVLKQPLKFRLIGEWLNPFIRLYHAAYHTHFL